MRLSVIISTRNRAFALPDCLKSVTAALTYAQCCESEIVVVDNASTDNTSEVVEAWGSEQPVNVRLIKEHRPGLSYARNAGTEAATGELIVFTDDDCQMSETYVEELLRYDSSDRQPVLRSGSVVLGDPTDLPITIKSVDEPRVWQKPMNVDGEGQLLSSLIGCNMAIRRRELIKLGPFDTRLGAGTSCPAGEDTDLFYRAYLAGFRLEMVPDMLIKHHHGRKTSEDKARLLQNYSVGNAALFAKYLFTYPNFSRHLYWELKYILPKLVKRYEGIDRVGDISPRDRLSCMVRGIFRFYIASIKRCVSFR